MKWEQKELFLASFCKKHYNFWISRISNDRKSGLILYKRLIFCLVLSIQKNATFKQRPLPYHILLLLSSATIYCQKFSFLLGKFVTGWEKKKWSVISRIRHEWPQLVSKMSPENDWGRKRSVLSMHLWWNFSFWKFSKI